MTAITRETLLAESAGAGKSRMEDENINTSGRTEGEWWDTA